MKQRAFTLIELLVVIAIIGVIASIVSVNLGRSRRKATIGKALSFSQSINHGLGAYAVAIWTFDDSIADGTSTDVSGYNNHGQIFGDPVQIEGIMRKALQFNGDDYLDCGRNKLLYPAATLTIEAWLRIYSFDNWPGIVGIYEWGNPANTSYLLSLENVQNQIAFFWSDGFDTNSTRCGDFKDLSEWTHVVVTFNHGLIKFYENGTHICTRGPWQPNLNQNPPTASFKIGKQSTYYFKGEIDELKIYGVPLEATEVKKHYVEGLKEYRLVEK